MLPRQPDALALQALRKGQEFFNEVEVRGLLLQQLYLPLNLIRLRQDSQNRLAAVDDLHDGASIRQH